MNGQIRQKTMKTIDLYIFYCISKNIKGSRSNNLRGLHHKYQLLFPNNYYIGLSIILMISLLHKHRTFYIKWYLYKKNNYIINLRNTVDFALYIF